METSIVRERLTKSGERVVVVMGTYASDTRLVV
jgi:hypothetical protein